MIDPSRIPGLLGALSLLHLARRGLRRRSGAVAAAERERAAFYREAWADAARELRAELRVLEGDLLEIRRGAARARVMRNYTALDDPLTLRIAGDKALVHRLLAEQGVPTPRHAVFRATSLGPARAFLREQGGLPCVVKPASGTGGGEGVTTGVRTQAGLGWAAARAALHGPTLLVEEQIEGANYRLLFLDGELLDAVRRRPPTLIGDGRSPIRALVRRANDARQAGGHRVAQGQLSLDRELRATLAEQGKDLASVPRAGERVRVKRVVNENACAENEGVPVAALAPELVARAAGAAAALGVRLAGVDVITSDASRPLEATGGVVLEVNTAPGHHLHVHRRGSPFPVALHALAALLGSAERAPRTARRLAAIGARA